MADKTTNLQLQKIDNTDYAGNFPTIYNNNLDLIDVLNNKQDKLIAGSGIQIASDGKTISSSGKEYAAGSGIQISSDGVISVVNPSEINVYSPIILGKMSTNFRSGMGSGKEITRVQFGTGKRTYTSYSIPITNTEKSYSTINGLVYSSSISIKTVDFPDWLKPVDGKSVNLSMIILDSQFSLIGTANKTITNTNNFSISFGQVNARDGELTVYLINASF